MSGAFRHIPFLRICIPFTAGILTAIQFDLPGIPWLFMFMILLGLAGCFFAREQHRVIKTTFMLGADVFLFCFAINLVNAKNTRNDPQYYGKYLNMATANKLTVLVKDLPVEKERFIKCELEVLQVKSQKGYVDTKGKLVGYFRRSRASRGINFGKVMLINSSIQEIEPPKNPGEFNYKNYMANRQVHYLSFIDSSSFVPVPSSSRVPALWLLGVKIKEHVLRSLRTGGLDRQAYAISAALLTGYDDDIDEPVMEAFSHSGTLHVLSVSGLHTGLIYLVLSFIFDLIDRKRKHKLLKFIFIISCLCLFALITGFSAPVLRAVLMFGLLGLGKLFFRNDHRNQLNILLVSAFILLCYDPFLIKDIGFQLSYFAMFGILFFQPVFSGLWKPRSILAEKTWQSVSASFAATLTTLPFTLFYFKQFPLWFFVCNLVVVPATFVVLLLAVLVVLKVPVAALLINFIIKALVGFINVFNVPGSGFIENIHFEWIDALLMSVLIAFISSALYYRSFRYTVYALLLIIAWQMNGILVSCFAKNQSMLAVYHVNHRQAYAVKNKKEVLVDSLAAPDFNYHIKPHLVSFNYPRVQKGTFNYVKCGRQEVLSLNKKDHWPQCDQKQITTLVVSNNFRLQEDDLEKFTALKILVADGSNNSYITKQLGQLCSKFGIQFYVTKQNGAYILEL